MTERPEGTPDATPAEPEAAPHAETVTGAPEAPAAETEEIESEAGDFEPETDEAEIDEIDEEFEAEEAEADELADELEDEVVVPLGVEPAAPLVAATAAAGARRRGAPAPSVQRAPTQSELAVRVTDNASRFFVIATVVVFAAILAYGLFAGNGGLLTTTPAPPTAAPSASVSAEPSASSSAGASSSPGPSAAPSEPGASASPS
jgi:hypothetical protein